MVLSLIGAPVVHTICRLKIGKQHILHTILCQTNTVIYRGIKSKSDSNL
jgi:hypothetical protein